MNSAPTRPPGKITSSDRTLLCYAVLDDAVGYTVGHGLFFVDGKEIGKVPCLAICQDKNSGLFTLYYCGTDWNVLGVATDNQSIEAAKQRQNASTPVRQRVGWELDRVSGDATYRDLERVSELRVIGPVVQYR